ncbi:hypothetical protein E1H13_20260 [Nodosilinea sp. P-1105]|nr:hypothetical protein [Nodosilinea sp. P-1105]
MATATIPPKDRQPPTVGYGFKIQNLPTSPPPHLPHSPPPHLPTSPPPHLPTSPSCKTHLALESSDTPLCRCCAPEDDPRWPLLPSKPGISMLTSRCGS